MSETFTTWIEIEAAPESVFEFLVTESKMTAWMGQHAELDPRVGGRFEVDIAGHAIRGRYLEVDPPRRVVVSWGIAGSSEVPAASTTVTFDLTATARGTRVDLCHAHLPTARLEGHADGWAHFLSRLRVVATGGADGPDHWQPNQPGRWTTPQESGDLN